MIGNQNRDFWGAGTLAMGIKETSRVLGMIVYICKNSSGCTLKIRPYEYSSVCLRVRCWKRTEIKPATYSREKQQGQTCEMILVTVKFLCNIADTTGGTG